MGCGASKSSGAQVEESRTEKVIHQRSRSIEQGAGFNSKHTHADGSSSFHENELSLRVPSLDSVSTKSNLPYHEYKTTIDSKNNFESPVDYTPTPQMLQNQVKLNSFQQQQHQILQDKQQHHLREIELLQQKQLELYQREQQQMQARQMQMQQPPQQQQMIGSSSRSSSRPTSLKVPAPSVANNAQKSATPKRSLTPTPLSPPAVSVASVPSAPSTAASMKTFIGVFEGMNILSRDEFVSKYTSEKMFRWRKAEIAYIDGEDRSKVLVHYTGWASTFDYWVDLDTDWERLAPTQLLSKEQCNNGTALDAEQSKLTKDYFLNAHFPITRKHSDSSVTRMSKENATTSSGDTKLIFVLGQKLDILDIFYKRGADMPSYKWRSAEIVDMSGTLITIHYENWDSKYDETLHIVQDAKRISAGGSRVKRSKNGDNRSVNTNNSNKSRVLYRESDVYELNTASNGNGNGNTEAVSNNNNNNIDSRPSANSAVVPGIPRSKSTSHYQASSASTAAVGEPTSAYSEPPPPYSPTLHSPLSHGSNIAAAAGAAPTTASRALDRSPRSLLANRPHSSMSNDPTYNDNSNNDSIEPSVSLRSRSGPTSHLRQKSDGALLGSYSTQQTKASRDEPINSPSRVAPARIVKRVGSNNNMPLADLQLPILKDVTYDSDADCDRSQGSKISHGSRISRASSSSPTKRLHNTGNGSMHSMSSPDLLEAALHDVLGNNSGGNGKGKAIAKRTQSFTTGASSGVADLPGVDLAAEGEDEDGDAAANGKPLKKKWSFTWGNSNNAGAVPENGEHDFPTVEIPNEGDGNGGKKLKKKWSFTWGNKDPEHDVPSEEMPTLATASSAESGKSARPRTPLSRMWTSTIGATAATAAPNSTAATATAATTASADNSNNRPVTMLVTHQKTPGSSSLVKNEFDPMLLQANTKNGHNLGDRMIRQFSMLSWSRIFRNVGSTPGTGLSEDAKTTTSAPSNGKDMTKGEPGIAVSASEAAVGSEGKDSSDPNVRNFELEIGGEDIADEDVDPEGARKAEEEAIRERYFLEKLEEKGLHVFEIEGDGNCLFRAVSHQLYLDQDMHEELRARCVDHLVKNRKRFECFCGTDFDQHMTQMRLLGTWGDDLEIRALEEICDRVIMIYSSDVEKVDEPINNNFEELTLLRGVPPIKLSYHGQSHYNSIYDERFRLPLANRTTRILQRSRLALYKGQDGRPPSSKSQRRPRSQGSNPQNPAAAAATTTTATTTAATATPTSAPAAAAITPAPYNYTQQQRTSPYYVAHGTNGREFRK